MNLRFGLHTPAFANKEVYWQFAPRKEPRKPKREPKPRAAPTRASARLAACAAADTQRLVVEVTSRYLVLWKRSVNERRH